MEQLILVNEHDEPVGTAEKMEAHRNGGRLHRAFSIFIFNSQQKILLQQRSKEKYHSGGLWTNTCCSHPRPGEDTKEAAQRRLQQEMGFDAPLHKAFEFTYQVEFDNGLTEWEYDHVFVGQYNGSVQPNPTEVSNYCYQTLSEIKAGIKLRPGNYTEWFKIALPHLESYLNRKDAAE